ncbi:MAG: LTA synthase family protein, partial [Saprospiraceae bacterium]
NTSRWGLLALPVWLALLALGIRGGLGVMPINESAVYYSAHLFDNHAATNTGWYFLHSLIEVRSTENHYRTMSREEAEGRVDRLLGHTVNWAETNYSWFNTIDSANSRPNVVFIIMESMTAQVVEELDGEKGVCPTLSRLIREGILFDHCYGSGYRTDQGIVSVLGGYPAQPDQSIVLLTDKAAKLNSVPKALHQHGYSTGFFYGGELTFANIGVWLRNQQFEKIISESDFTAAEKTQRWGVDDGILLQRAAREIGQLKPPFFATAMTLSLHPPYDVPYQSQWQGSSDREKFLNSAAFADHALGEFFKTAEQQPWYANTIFVLVADHGVSPPNGFGLDNPKARRVPLIIFGQPLTKQYHGKRIGIFANHHDIAATTLRMLNDRQEKFPWSRDLWFRQTFPEGHKMPVNEQSAGGFAYYTNENGIGWVNRQGAAFYQFKDKTWQTFEGKLDSASQQDAKAYLQILYDDFLKL